MKALSLACALFLSTTAMADPALIRLHAPKNPNPALFGYDTLCHVQNLGTSTGLWQGVCRYVGYRNVNQYGIVEWDDSGSGRYVQNCRLANDYTAQHTGWAVCPDQTYGPFQYVVVNGNPIPVFVQGTDTVGVMAVIIDGSPRTSGLVTP